MKIAGNVVEVPGAPAPEAPSVVPDDSGTSTRDRVARSVLARGPVTAAELADELGLTPAAVRRHLDGLSDEGLLTAWQPPRGTAEARRGRGRPPRSYVLTDAGHAAMATAYDDLAASALQFLEEVAGPEAVRRFASRQVEARAARYRPAVEAAGESHLERVTALASALTEDGYAATARGTEATGPGRAGGIQLCQAHCPVQQVAQRFPQLCEAETEAFSRLLGVHVQRLATVAHGAHVCTTHVPAPHVPDAGTNPQERTRR